MVWRRSNESGERSLADLFAGVAIALLLILIALWLQALHDAVEADERRREAEAYKERMQTMEAVQNIFHVAFEALKGDDAIIEVDSKKGEFSLKAEQVFAPGRWEFRPSRRDLETFLATRNQLAEVLEHISREFSENALAKGEKLEAKDYLEVLIVGHTDCKLFKREDAGLVDNWDLSVLRAAALARFFTEPCATPGTTLCCLDGGSECAPEQYSRRIDAAKWRVLPAGRGQYEPQRKVADIDFRTRCDGLGADEAWLAEQRRVVIQIVPRLDRLAVKLVEKTPSP